MNQLRDVDIEEYYERQRGQRKRYEGANVRFYTEIRTDEEKTKKEGRPICYEVEFIEIHYPGCDKTPRPVEPRDKEEYALQYNAWKEGRTPPTVGTPLSEWAMIPRAIVEELAFFGFKTVEQLSSPSDEVKKKLGPLSKWVKRAKEYIAAAKSDQNQMVSLKEQLERETARANKLEEQFELALQRISALEGTKITNVPH